MAIRRHSKKPEKERQIALDRVEALFSEAEKRFKENSKLSNRYVELARKIAMRLKVRIRPELKRRFCKHCHAYLKPGVNLRVRVTDGHMTYYCLACKKFMRFPHRKNSKKPE